MASDPATHSPEQPALTEVLGDSDKDAKIPLAPLVLPQQKPPFYRLRKARRIKQLDCLILFAVILLAFLLGSFVARNSDLWMHLATGRALVQGSYHLGADPFSTTMPATSWVNHNWLFDVLAYGAYQTIGGSGLVILKALGFACLAVLLVGLGWKDQSPWIAVAFTIVSLLALDSRMALQPICVSYLFLASTLWFLQRPYREAQQNVDAGDLTYFSRVKEYWPIVVLMILWVNLDSWFLLGPITIGLYALGQGIQDWAGVGKKPQENQAGEGKVLLGVLALTLVACLLNPYHFHAFVFPAQVGLSETAHLLQQDPSLSGLFASPFQGAYLRSLTGFQVAGWAYFLLVLSGLVSFAPNIKAWSWPRAFVWSAFFLLSAYLARLIPFFAIVAGPLTALNLQEFFSRRNANVENADVPSRRWAVAGRALMALGVIALVVVAWPGWLQPQVERREWATEPDPSLPRAAKQIAQWRKDGKLETSARGMNLSPETANYFAWACPEEKGFVDSRMQMSPEAAADFVVVRQALLSDANQATDSSGKVDKPRKDWREILRSRHVNHIILYDSELRRIIAPLRRLLAAEKEWPLLYLDGRTAVFGWNDPDQVSPVSSFAAMQADVERLAFDPGPEEQAPSASAGQEPRLRRWWDDFLRPVELRSLDTDEAACRLMQFEIHFPRYAAEKRARMEKTLAVSAIGLAAAQGYPISNQCFSLGIGAAGLYLPGLAVTHSAPNHRSDAKGNAAGNLDSYLIEPDVDALATPLVAIRAARRALASKPDDADAYHALGQAYATLNAMVGNAMPGDNLPMLSMLRHVQMVTALEEAVRINPELEAVHDVLAAIYTAKDYLDIALEHRRAELRIALRSGPRPRETAEEFARRTKQSSNLVRDLEEKVQNRQNDFIIRSGSLKLDSLVRAQMALGLGLPLQALDHVLLPSNVMMFGTAGAKLEITMLLMLGRMGEARQLLDDPDLMENKARLEYFEFPSTDLNGRSRLYRVPAYDWLGACQLAASGDYERAVAALRAMQSRLSFEFGENMPRFRRGYAQTLASETAMSSDPLTLFSRIFIHDVREQYGRELTKTYFLEEEQADILALAGFLALEQGASKEAEDYLSRSIALGAAGAVPGAKFASWSLTVALLNRIEAAREAK